MVGKILEFGESDAEIKYAKELMVQVLGTKFKSRLTLLDMESRFEIYIEVDGKYSVYMGNRENMKLKLEAVEKALQSDKLKDCTSAEIDASDPAVVAIRPQFDYKESNAVEEAEQSEK